MNNLGRPLISLGGSKNERFKKQPKQSQSTISHAQDYNDVVRNRKDNQSTLQIAANSILENNNSRPSVHGYVGASGSGLPPRMAEMRRHHDNNSVGMLGHQYTTDNDSYSQSIEDSGNMNTDIVVDKPTDDYIVDMKKGNSNILVGVRCRPLSTKEKQKQSVKSVKILDEKIIILQDVSAARPEEAFRIGRSKEKTYAFDYAFDEDIGQSYIFDKTTRFLIDGIMQGYNASVFAYGATGAGKTYTMLGTEDEPGIMMQSIDELFNCIERYQSERDYKLKISYVEVYNENIKDLLTERNEYLDLREDNVKGVCVAGVTEIMTTNVDEIMRYIRQGNRQRTKERTDANEASSRSHAVLQITVEHKDKAHGINAEINIAKLSLIDLAGSERASNTNNRGLRLVEGANINKSLLALGNCINALCEQTKMGPIAAKNQHIPYRDSKLTRLLKDSLGGNCRTVMIANISPAFAAYEDTLNTLKYADRAKQIKTIVKRNVLNVEFHISNYTKIINQLREEIVNLRGQLAGSAQKPLAQLSLQNQSKSAQQQSQNAIAQTKLKTMKIEMNLQFEKEVMIKKDIYELDMQNEDLAFKLFSKQLNLTKSKGKPITNQPLIEQEIKQLKDQIDANSRQKEALNQQLSDLEMFRTKMLDEYQQEMLQYEIEAIDVLYNQHLLNLKQIDIKRKENRAEFHIKQRDNYIAHLKEQLSLRDRIIKEKLGLSVTNFMPGGGTISNNSYTDGGFDILSMQDIDKMSRELILPSLNMTKSSSFIPNAFSSPLDQQHPKGKIDISDSPYSQGFTSNMMTSPNQRQVLSFQQRRAISNTINVQNKQKLQGLKNASSDEGGNYPGYSNQLKMSSNAGNLSQQQNAYYQSEVKKAAQIKQNNSGITNLTSADKKIMSKKASHGASNELLSISFSSHRQNSNSRIGIGVGNAYQGLQQQILQQAQNNAQLPPPGTSGGESTSSNQGKSFANEMSKNKQKFIMMQKQQLIQNPNDVFATRGQRAIPKNPLSINKKLSLLKKNNLNSSSHNVGGAGNISGDDTSSNIPLTYQSSRNQNQSQGPGSRIGGGTSNLIQNNGSQIANFNIKRQSEAPSQYHNNSTSNIANAYGGSSINSSIINIAENY